MTFLFSPLSWIILLVASAWFESLILSFDFYLWQRYEDTSIYPQADVVKLYYHFLRLEGSGLAGIFIVAFLYVFTMFMSASILYMYFLRYL